MAAATVRDTQGLEYGSGNPNAPSTGLRFAVMWNGYLIALCNTQADANAVAALHPA